MSNEGWIKVERKNKNKNTRKPKTQVQRGSHNGSQGGTLAHQDWTPRVLSNRSKRQNDGKPRRRSPSSQATMTSTGRPAWKLEQNAEDGVFHHNKPTKKLKTRIQQARAAKKWSQKDLAQHANVQQHIVQAYENGTAVIKPKELRALSQALGCSLSNK